MVDYKSTHTGLQVDEAVDRVLTNNCIVKFQNIIGEVSDNTQLQAALDALKNTHLTLDLSGEDYSVKKDAIVQTFADVLGYIMDTKTFTYLTYNNNIYLPLKASTTQITFTSPFDSNAYVISSNNEVTISTDNLVHKTGDETIAGTKTFNNTIVGSVNGNANTATNDIDGNPIKTTYQKVSNLSQVINESETNYPSNKAVKTAIDAKDSLPSQTGNAGKFLTTDGSNASWENSYTPPLLSCMWSDHLLSDMSWLRADTFSWQDGTTYSLIYNELLSEYNNSASTAEKEGSIIFKRTPKGYKIALSTQETAILNKYNSDGIAWYYILDTTNTRFKLPRTKYDFVGLRDSVGGYVAESLPNIKGQVVTGEQFIGTSGAFYAQESSGTRKQYEREGNPKTVLFNASHSSSVYQDNAPVQQRATQMYLYFYVGNYTQSAIQQTAGLNAELFNDKVDINGSNLSAQGRSYFSGFGMPSNRYIDLTLGASGSTYTAPANGWVFIETIHSNDSLGWLDIINITRNFIISCGKRDYCSNIMPLLKGDSFAINYDGSYLTSSTFRFIYAEGGTTSGGTTPGGTTPGGTTPGGGNN